MRKPDKEYIGCCERDKPVCFIGSNLIYTKGDGMFYKRTPMDIKTQLEEKRSDLIKELSDLPDGQLLIYEKRGKRYYCQMFPKKGNRKKERRIGITKDTDMVFSLVRKRYLKRSLNLIAHDISVIEKALAKFSPINEEAVMAEFIERYPELEAGMYYGLRNTESWADDYTQGEDFFEEDLKSLSSQGEKMRSGGEMYIASRLEHYGIPYRYESPTGIPDISYVPDFTILRPRDRKIIYWEHFGKIDDNEYIKDNIRKVEKYIEYGISPWDNLIMTYNNKRGGYDGKLIDAMIKGWLL